MTVDIERKKVEQIKERLGKEKMDKIRKYLDKKQTASVSPAKLIATLADKFDMPIADASSCWYGWQVYAL